MKKYTQSKKGFTLIELLIVIAIISTLIAGLFTALNPLKRFKDTRDARRWTDVIAILNAVVVDQVDNRGFYIEVISNLETDKIYMIGTATSGCDDKNAYCLSNVAGDDYCVDITDLVNEYYLGKVPIAPAGNTLWSASLTGYTLERVSTDNIAIRACEVENEDAEIFVVH